LHAAATDGELKIIEGMNHVLRDVKGDLNAQMRSYFNPNLPLHNELGGVVLEFIKTADAARRVAAQ